MVHLIGRWVVSRARVIHLVPDLDVDQRESEVDVDLRELTTRNFSDWYSSRDIENQNILSGGEDLDEDEENKNSDDHPEDDGEEGSDYEKSWSEEE